MTLITARCMLHLLPTREGGRSVAVRSNFRPNHNFDEGRSPLTMYIGSVVMGPDEYLEPGEFAEVIFQFTDDGALRDKIYPGRKWTIQEGLKVVGYGEILAVIGDEHKTE